MVLLEEKNEQFEDFMERSMEIYLAPAETMKTYLDGMKYRAQTVSYTHLTLPTIRLV